MSKDYDPNYKVPEGFSPWLTYPEEYPDGVPYIDRVTLKIDGDLLSFYIKEKIPALPLKGYGELWYTGWEIPTEWAIDANNQCWLSGSHGEALMPTKSKKLINAAETDEDKECVCNILGVKPPESSWVEKAKLRGWLSPEEVKKLKNKIKHLEELILLYEND